MIYQNNRTWKYFTGVHTPPTNYFWVSPGFFSAQETRLATVTCSLDPKRQNIQIVCFKGTYPSHQMCKRTQNQNRPAEFHKHHSPKQCKVLPRFSGTSVFSFTGVEYFLSINGCFSVGVLLVSGFLFLVALRGSANIRTSLGNAVSTWMAPAFILASRPSSVPNSSVCEIL